MTFEPIDHDETDELVTTRRRGRHAERRQLAILGALWRDGAAFETDLCRRVRRWPGTLYPDLITLAYDGKVVTERIATPNGERTAYRLMTDDERTAWALEVAETEQRLRAALKAYAEQIGDEPR